MRVELHPVTSSESFWRIMPRFKVRSVGDKVRTHDEIVLERATSRGQYIGVSVDALRLSNSATGDGKGFEKAFCTPHVHEVSASVKKASFVLDKYEANDTMQRPRIPARGSIEAFIKSDRRSQEPLVEEAAPSISAGDVIQLFHKDSDCWVSAEGTFRDPLAPASDGGPERMLAEDIHLRHRVPNIEKPNKLRPPTSAVSYFQVEKADLYEGGKVGWKSKVRFRHLTSQLYLSLGAEVTGEAGTKWGTKLVANGTGNDSIFYIHPVIQEGAHVPSDAYIRVQHFNKSWLHASSNPIKRGCRTGGGGSDFAGFGSNDSTEEMVGSGIEQAGSVTWDKAELTELM